jgi:hypothetical protein
MESARPPASLIPSVIGRQEARLGGQPTGESEVANQPAIALVSQPAGLEGQSTDESTLASPTPTVIGREQALGVPPTGEFGVASQPAPSEGHKLAN